MFDVCAHVAAMLASLRTQDWDVFAFVAIAMNVFETTFLKFVSRRVLNYKYNNSSQAFCSCIRYRSSMKFFRALSQASLLQKCGEDCDRAWGGMGNNYMVKSR